jgi:hypothetical protein
MRVLSNFALTLSSTISKTGPVGGTFKTWVSPADLPVGDNTTTVYAKLEKADLSATTGGATNVEVARIKIHVVPQ